MLLVPGRPIPACIDTDVVALYGVIGCARTIDIDTIPIIRLPAGVAGDHIPGVGCCSTHDIVARAAPDVDADILISEPGRAVGRQADRVAGDPVGAAAVDIDPGHIAGHQVALPGA